MLSMPFDNDDFGVGRSQKQTKYGIELSETATTWRETLSKTTKKGVELPETTQYWRIYLDIIAYILL